MDHYGRHEVIDSRFIREDEQAITLAAGEQLGALYQLVRRHIQEEPGDQPRNPKP